MLKENSFPAAFDTTAAEPGCDTSRRHFINHAGRGLLAVGVASALPLAAEAQAGKAKPAAASRCPLRRRAVFSSTPCVALCA